MSEVIGRQNVTTRKPHVCFGCGREFKPGTRMERSFVIDDRPWICYLCQTCIRVEGNLQYGDEFGFSELRTDALELEEQERRRR